jgi:tRNA nucleotidyltransferase/poly(A) polymerase
MIFPDRLNPETQSWMKGEGPRAIWQAMRDVGGEARVVGGAVRDSLLKRKIEDIDFAVNLPPEAVASALEKAGMKAVPTGLEYGTITAIVDKKGYEITSLRRDIETDGRHAKVFFTDDCKLMPRGGILPSTRCFWTKRGGFTISRTGGPIWRAGVSGLSVRQGNALPKII